MAATIQRILAIGQRTPPAYCTANRAFVAGLYQKAGRPILFKVARLTGGDFAEEILQETFARLVASNLDFESEQSAFRWLYTCSHRLAIDHLRSAPVRTTCKPSQRAWELISASPNIGFARTSAEAKVLWQQLAKLLDPREIEVALYHYSEGLSQEEIAELLGVSRKTIVRTIASLREKIDRLKGEET